MRYSPTEPDTTLWRNVTKWTVAFALFLALLALMTSLSLYQLTSEGPAKETLRRGVAALTEIDPLLARNYDDLTQRASAAGESDTVVLADFPVQVPLTRDEALLPKRQLRDLLLQRSVDVMYSRGPAPLREPGVATSGTGRFSAAGLTDRALGFLRHRNHDILGAFTFVLAATSVVLALTLATLCRGFGRLGSVGGAVLAAATPVVAIGIGARFYMRIIADDNAEYIQREFLEIGQGLAWIPIRNGAAFTVLGAAFLLLGIGCAIWADRRETTGRENAQLGELSAH